MPPILDVSMNRLLGHAETDSGSHTYRIKAADTERFPDFVIGNDITL